MTPESEEILSSMCDGASVDPHVLAEALAEPEAAALLVDYARVRRAVETDAEAPRAAFSANLGRVVAHGRRWWRGGPSAPVAVVAALVILAVAAGAIIGRLSSPRTSAWPVDLAACVGPSGMPFEPGAVTAIDGARVRCVVKGEWVPVSR